MERFGNYLNIPADGTVCLTEPAPESTVVCGNPAVIACRQGIEPNRQGSRFAGPGLGVDQQAVTPVAQSDRDLVERRAADQDVADLHAMSAAAAAAYACVVRPRVSRFLW